VRELGGADISTSKRVLDLLQVYLTLIVRKIVVVIELQ